MCRNRNVSGPVTDAGPGAGIVYLKGPYTPALLSLCRSVGAGRVFFSRRYEPAMAGADQRVEAALRGAGIHVRSFNPLLLREPWDVRVDMSTYVGHFGTLTPFARACGALGHWGRPVHPPPAMPLLASKPAEGCGERDGVCACRGACVGAACLATQIDATCHLCSPGRSGTREAARGQGGLSD